ncbi:MAG: glycosyltransferase family 87 protein, partial [Acidimicrobiales bacterium]
MAALSRLQQRAILLPAVAWAALIVATASHKSGDLTPQLGQAERWLHGLPLYEANPSLGTWWPPFTVLVLAPFVPLARASLPLAKAAWAVLSIAGVTWSVVQVGRRWGWGPALLALVIVAPALHNSFEHGQITALLLALVVAAAVDLDDGREVRAGAWSGAAAAVKAFPALLLPYLAWTGRWRACVAGVGIAALLTIGVMLPYGPVDAVRAVLDWLRLAAAAPGTEGFAMQKLGRLVRDLGGPPVVTIALAVGLLAACAAALKRPAPRGDSLREV